jgi:23S rRNA (cytidine1920-2'-O)/16S rRNA (cytidine1409-2'-O)-methyltransferase
MARIRLDERLVRDGHAENKSQAQRLIMAGVVRVDGQRSDKAGTPTGDGSVVEVEAPARFVSRGGDKLANAFDDLAAEIAGHGWSVDGAQALDVGSSTGGFTDCLLQNGAAEVAAVDVGYGQLHPKLRDDPRVTVMERVNARHLSPGDLPFAPNLVVCDASFISLATVMRGPISCMAPNWWGLLLCKPQFEAGPQRLGKGGVVRDDAIRDEIVAETIGSIEQLGVRVVAKTQAHPPGPKGNIEYVLLVCKA